MTEIEPEQAVVTESCTPIFVLGLQRSGTTWVASLLCQNRDCVGVRSDAHGGVFESLFFSHFSRAYGDLSSKHNFSRFARDFGQSEYFLLSRLPKDWLSCIKARSYHEIFEEMMREFANRHNATHWVEKSPQHSLYSNELARLFPDGRFICLLRDPVSHIASLMNAPWRSRKSYPARAVDLLTACATYVLYTKHLTDFSNGNRGSLLVRYEDIVGAPEESIRQICQHVGLTFDPGMLEAPFRRNSSFKSKGDRKKALSRSDLFFLRLFLPAMRLVPRRALLFLNKFKMSRKRNLWPVFVWSSRPLQDRPPAVCP